jgi:hypothetical protein
MQMRYFIAIVFQREYSNFGGCLPHETGEPASLCRKTDSSFDITRKTEKKIKLCWF